MKIGVLENELSSKRGGQELSLLDVCEGLSKRGHSIALLYLTSGDLQKRYELFCENMTRIYRYTVHKYAPLSSSFQYVRSLWKGSFKKVDLIYANQYQDSFFGGMLAKLKGVPLVCHLRLPPPSHFCGQYRIGLSQASRLITISEKTHQEYVNRGFCEDAIDVVHNGIATDRYIMTDSCDEIKMKKGIPLGSFVITYAGRFHPAKGIKTLLKAFSLFKMREKNGILLLSGSEVEDWTTRHDGKYVQLLQEEADRLGIQKDIFWQGHEQNIPDLFGISDVVVLPSLWSEPFGRILIEAMACGTPAVGSQVGGISEILSGEFSRFLFTAGDSEALACLLAQVKELKQQDPDISRRCKNHVSLHFSLSQNIKKIENIFQQTQEDYEAKKCKKVVASWEVLKRIHPEVCW